MPTLHRHQGTPPPPLPNTPPTLPWAAALCVACLALAASLYTRPAAADPMRPLAAALPPAAPGAQPEAGRPTPTAPAAAPVRRLLAIRQDINGERAALFGDRWVRVGDSFMTPEGHTLVLAIGPTHIEWEQGRVRSTHHLLAPLLPAQWPVTAPVPTPRDATRTAAAQLPPASPRKSGTPPPDVPAPPSLPSPPAPSQAAPLHPSNPHRETVKP